ncbi:MAG: GTP-binding protein, partial [Chloroflexi bacterium]|nr:GTP-binding protein [Chloroflexota bacterium]
MRDRKFIRNFSIIAHIDHGKTTLSDRFLEVTGTVTDRERRDQLLDGMELEREKGITIKAKAVRMDYTASDGQMYQLNLIDCPGHVDFTYEVSRALAACEGAILVVDAAQGVEAQTLANVYLAMEHDLEIIPVLNKIDLPGAHPDFVAAEVERILGVPAADVLRASAKNGIGIKEILDAVVERVPHPQGDPEKPVRALIFDSHYDVYKGVIAYVRVIEGELRGNSKVRFMTSAVDADVLEIGYFHPTMVSVDS